MTIKKLCEVCAEYDQNTKKISILKSSIEGNKKYPHLQWSIDRDTEALNKLVNRQTKIKELINNNDTIVF